MPRCPIKGYDYSQHMYNNECDDCGFNSTCPAERYVHEANCKEGLQGFKFDVGGLKTLESYDCPYCDVKHNSYESIFEHMDDHLCQQEYSFECLWCRKRFPSEKKAKAHCALPIHAMDLKIPLPKKTNVLNKKLKKTESAKNTTRKSFLNSSQLELKKPLTKSDSSKKVYTGRRADNKNVVKTPQTEVKFLTKTVGQTQSRTERRAKRSLFSEQTPEEKSVKEVASATKKTRTSVSQNSNSGVSSGTSSRRETSSDFSDIPERFLTCFFRKCQKQFKSMDAVLEHYREHDNDEYDSDY